MKILKIGRLAALVGLLGASAASLASTSLSYPWYGTPYAYTSVMDCQWIFTGSYGGSWGSQFNYVSSGSCAYKTMQVNHQVNASTATVVLN